MRDTLARAAGDYNHDAVFRSSLVSESLEAARTAESALLSRLRNEGPNIHINEDYSLPLCCRSMTRQAGCCFCASECLPQLLAARGASDAAGAGGASLGCWRSGFVIEAPPSLSCSFMQLQHQQPMPSLPSFLPNKTILFSSMHSTEYTAAAADSVTVQHTCTMNHHHMCSLQFSALTPQPFLPKSHQKAAAALTFLYEGEVVTPDRTRVVGLRTD